MRLAAHSLFSYYKSCENPYQYYQVTRESVSSTTSHMRVSKRAMDKIIITIVPSYTGKKYHSFVVIGIVTHAAHL